MGQRLSSGLQSLFVSELPVRHGKPLADDMGGPPGQVHDWRNHVPVRLRQLWPTLSNETRMALFLVAQEQADKEEWD